MAFGPVCVSDGTAVSPAKAVSRTCDSQSGVVSDGTTPESVAVVFHRVKHVLHVLFGLDCCDFTVTVGTELSGIGVGVPEGVGEVLEFPLAGWMVPFIGCTRPVHHNLVVDTLLSAFDIPGGTAGKEGSSSGYSERSDHVCGGTGSADGGDGVVLFVLYR